MLFMQIDPSILLSSDAIDRHPSWADYHAQQQLQQHQAGLNIKSASSLELQAEVVRQSRSRCQSPLLPYQLCPPPPTSLDVPLSPRALSPVPQYPSPVAPLSPVPAATRGLSPQYPSAAQLAVPSVSSQQPPQISAGGSPCLVRRNLPPQLNLQPPAPPGLSYLSIPSPSSPGYVQHHSPFLSPSQPQSRTPSPISMLNCFHLAVSYCHLSVYCFDVTYQCLIF